MLIRFVLALVFACIFAACGDDSSSVSPEPAGDSSSSVAPASSGNLQSSSSQKNSGKDKSSSSVKSGDDSQNGSSSSGYVLRDSLCSSEYEGGTKYISQYNIKYYCINGHWVLLSSSSSKTYKTCTSEKEGVEAYISQEESWCICTNGFWIPVSSSSTEPSSSSKYYDMSRLFENEKGYSYGEFTDPRDGQVYKTIRYEVGYQMIDSLTFFAQNLNYGKMIPGGTQMTDSTKFCYDDDPWYCDNGFGGLYTWATVMNFPAACDSFAMGSAKCPVEYDLTRNPVPEYQGRLSFVMHQGICPEGWHVMNLEEWAMVMEGTVIMDGASYLGAVLWGSNQRGFSLLPAGKLQADGPGSSYYKGIEKYAYERSAYHWIPGEYKSKNSDYVGGLVAYVTWDHLNRGASEEKFYGLSVRCTKDY
ncbi:MAG: hypothetical protein IK114_06415 [Fibrobacter sp.]|nr:hypothetical protein [Fibrobacter sp.]